MANIFDVAKYILTEIGGVSTMKLQKLCYYSLVESLRRDPEHPLFCERFEAWANGPVCRELFDVHKGKFTVNKAMIPNKLLSDDFSSEDAKIVSEVIEKYGVFSGAELSEKTHREAPWTKAREGYLPTESCNVRIKNSDICEFYRN